MFSHLNAVSMVPRAAARGDEAPEVSAPRHAPSTHPALRLRSSHAPLAPAVSPARGHEDVMAVHNLIKCRIIILKNENDNICTNNHLLAHAAAKVEIGPAVRLPASLVEQSTKSSIID